jgi:MSHA biogenesis protein MshJ
MIKQQWDKVSTKVNALSMRERVLVFATVTVVVLLLLNMLLLEPLFARQKALHSQISQQQQTMLEVQAQIAALVLENSPNAKSPQRSQINQIRQEIAEGNAYLKKWPSTCDNC